MVSLPRMQLTLPSSVGALCRRVCAPHFSAAPDPAHPAGLAARSWDGGGGGGGSAERRAAHKGSGDDGAIRCQCRCRSGLDDGFSIACDVCGRWCHAAACPRTSAGMATTTANTQNVHPRRQRASISAAGANGHGHANGSGSGGGSVRRGSATADDGSGEPRGE
ncbi:hypothetical protein B0H10DRAFT_2131607, partial [Mycena sp. CBHHK59/15]